MSNGLDGKSFIKISELAPSPGAEFSVSDEFVFVQNGTTLKLSGQNIADSVTAIGNLASKGYVDTLVDGILGGAPGTLDTLNELALALNDEANFASTITGLINSKLNSTDFGLRFWDELTSVNTYNIAEGSNLYFTEQRVRDVLDSMPPPPPPDRLINGEHEVVLGPDGTLALSMGSNIYNNGSALRIDANRNIQLSAYHNGIPSTWTLGTNGTLALPNSTIISSVDIGLSFFNPSNGPGGYSVDTNSLTVGIPNPAWAEAIALNPGAYHIDFNGGPTGVAIGGISGPTPSNTNVYTLTGAWPSNSTGFPITIASNDHASNITKITSDNGAQIATTGGTWTFGADGALTVPGGGTIWSIGTGTVGLTANIADPSDSYLGLASGAPTLAGSNGVEIGAGNKAWNFDSTGVLSIPPGGDIKRNGVSMLDGGGTDLTGYATESYVTTAISNLVGSAPGVLDTLQEIAQSIGNDPTFYGDIFYAINQKIAKTSIDDVTLKFDGNGKLYATGVGVAGYTLPTATTSTLGGVKVDGTTITISNGVISSSAVPTLSSRTPGTVTSISLAVGGHDNYNITGYKGYALMSIQTSAAAWVTVYSSIAARLADASRAISTDPTPGSGVLAEVITTGATTQLFTPAIIGFSSEATPTTNIPIKIYNSGVVPAAITVTLTLLKLEM